jgi:hypothetical protein
MSRYNYHFQFTPPEMPLLFQYGSNCLTARLSSPRRLNRSAVVQGRAQTVDEYDLAFHVWSQTNEHFRATPVGCHKWMVVADLPECRGVEAILWPEPA